MAADPLQALQTMQILTGVYLTIAFAITIYQVFLNRRQAKVHEQMEFLLGEVIKIRVTLDEKFNK